MITCYYMTIMSIKYVFYFSPHQDDELLNLGTAICKDIDAGYEVFCVLCTDGGASGARHMLCNRGTCLWHGGRHDYPMDVSAFSAARDLEFTASCLAMGLCHDHIIIPANRANDGQSTEDQIIGLIKDVITGFPPAQVAIKTLAEVTWRRQNNDHTAAARAALRIRSEGLCILVEEYLETILYPAPEGIDIPETLTPGPVQRKRLLDAADCYCRWQPGSGFYAIGYHSVADEFIAFRDEQFSRLLIRR